MNHEDRATLIAQLDETLSKPGGKQALRYTLNSLGGIIPIAGGAIAGAGALYGEREQHKFNENIVSWAALADTDLQNINATLQKLLAKPTRASLSLLIGEILGDDIASEILSQPRAKVAVMINSATMTDLEPYIEGGWISVESTGSVCNMGAGNRVGDHIEELKRPYGMGNGFVLTFLN